MHEEYVLAARITEMVVHTCSSLINQPITIIDIGSHMGTQAHFLSRAFAHSQVIGIDRDQLCIQESRVLYPTIVFKEGLAQALPLPDESADLLVISLVLHHLSASDQVRALQECWRVLKINGIVCIIELNPHNKKVATLFQANEAERDAHMIDPRSLVNSDARWDWSSIEDDALHDLYIVKGCKK